LPGVPPYARDAGLTQSAADRLAALVRQDLAGTVDVEPEGRYFVLVVQTATGTCTLRDEADWAWFRRAVLGADPPRTSAVQSPGDDPAATASDRPGARPAPRRLR
jgi:hypothetical protein